MVEITSDISNKIESIIENGLNQDDSNFAYWHLMQIAELLEIDSYKESYKENLKNLSNREIIIKRISKFYTQYVPSVAARNLHSNNVYFEEWVLTKANRIMADLLKNLKDELTEKDMEKANAVLNYYEYFIEDSDIGDVHIDFTFGYPASVYRAFKKCNLLKSNKSIKTEEE